MWEEEISGAVASLTLNDSPAPFEQSNGVLRIRLVLPPRQVGRVRMVYRNDLDLSAVEIRKTNLHSYVLRRLSDFRDLYLSRTSWGTKLRQTYYGHGWHTTERYLERNWWIPVGVLAVLFGGLRYLRRSRASKRITQRNTAH